MRLILALLVALDHCVTTSYGPVIEARFWATPIRPFLQALLPMFFALSGYLVAGSLERSKTLLMFIGLRIIRIYPALFVEVLLSAFVLGPIMSAFSPRNYFLSGLFWRYLLNITGDIHFQLPGVFLLNPYPNLVNGQLWTIPYELLCYVTLSTLAILWTRRWRLVSLTITVGVIVGYAIIHALHHHGNFAEMQAALPGLFLVFSFLVGACIHLFRDRLPWDFRIFVAMVAISLVGLNEGGLLVYIFVPFSLAYVTVYLGLTNPTRGGFLVGADYSYGIFLYHFVVQQTVVHLIPAAQHWYVNAIVSIGLATAFAAASWHFIEKPALGSRRHLVKLENYLVGASSEKNPMGPYVGAVLRAVQR